MNLVKKCLALAFLSSGFSVFAGDWYVATNGTGQGTSREDATTNIHLAAASCASGYTVWVSNGVYNPANLVVGTGVTVRSKTGQPADVVLNGGKGEIMNITVTLGANSWLRDCTVVNGVGG